MMENLFYWVGIFKEKLDKNYYSFEICNCKIVDMKSLRDDTGENF